MIEYDQSYNVSSFGPLPEDQRKTIPIYHVDVPEQLVTTYKSEFLDPATRDLTLVHKDKGDFVRMFFVDPENTTYRSLSEKYGKPPPLYWGTKMQSHSTYMVWDAESRPVAYIKARQQDSTTSRSMVQAAVLVNDYVEKALAQKPTDYPISVFTERFGAAIHLPDVGDYAYSVRSINPNFVPHGDNLELLPLHGFLGSLKLSYAAVATGLSVDKWLTEEYAPKLGKFIARLNYEYGIYPEAHSQNLLIYLNTVTGRIQDFAFRDMADTAIDPFVWISPGNSPLPLTKHLQGPNSISRLGRWHTSAAAEAKLTDTPDAGWVNAGHIIQNNFEDMVKKSELKLLHGLTTAFLQSFVTEAQKMTGFDTDPAWNSRPALPQTYFENVYAAVVKKKLSSFVDRSLDYDQDGLMKLFYGHYNSTEEVAMIATNSREIIEPWAVLSSAAGKKPRFTYDGQNLIALDPKTRKPVAIVYDLSPEERNRIETSLVNESATLAAKLSCFATQVRAWLGN